MREIYSFETPPNPDRGFAVYLKNNYMLIVRNMKEFEKFKESLKSEDEIIGWQPIQTSKTVPPFMQNQLPT